MCDWLWHSENETISAVMTQFFPPPLMPITYGNVTYVSVLYTFKCVLYHTRECQSGVKTEQLSESWCWMSSHFCHLSQTASEQFHGCAVAVAVEFHFLLPCNCFCICAVGEIDSLPVSWMVDSGN